MQELYQLDVPPGSPLTFLSPISEDGDQLKFFAMIVYPRCAYGESFTTATILCYQREYVCDRLRLISLETEIKGKQKRDHQQWVFSIRKQFLDCVGKKYPFSVYHQGLSA